jgi:hypothetical protein
MKTRTKNQKINLNEVIFVMVAVLIFLSTGAQAQEKDYVSTLSKQSGNVSDLWTPEIKVNSIQGDPGTLIGIYGCKLINKSFLAGICGGVNLGHPRVNYGYLGAIGQYIFKPENIMHFSTQLVIGYGTTKDYENPKSDLFDNFWNISGAVFFIMETGVNFELNVSEKLTLATGMSYRYVSGLNESDENVSITHLTSDDLSGINFNIGLKILRKPNERHLYQ